METDKIYQIENATTFNSIDTKECREDNNLVDKNTDLEHNTVHDTKKKKNKSNKNLTTGIVENKQDDEVLDEKIDYDDAEDAYIEL